MNKNSLRMIHVILKKDAYSTRFIDELQKNMTLYHLKVIEGTIYFEILNKNLSSFKKIRKKYKSKVKLSRKDFDAFIKKDIFSAIAICLFITIPIILNAYIWDITIEEATPELEDSIAQIVKKQKTYVGMPVKKFSETKIRQSILAHHRELSWVFVSLQGSKMTIKVQYAPIVISEKLKTQKGDLIARRSGVITHANVLQGERIVTENDTVQKGEILVKGALQYQDEIHIIGARGEVYADYWFEVEFTLPKTIKMFVADNQSWQISGITISEGFAQLVKKIPVHIRIQHIVHSKEKLINLNEQHIETIIMPLLEQKILQQLAPNTIIKDQKLLHVAFDNDTVKGKLIFLINENIAQLQPFTQGD